MPSRNDVIAGLPSLGKVLKEGLNRDTAFLIQLVKDFEVSISRKGGRKLKLHLSEDLPVLLTTKEKQRFQEEASHDTEATNFVARLEQQGVHHYHGPYPFRWASGGYLPIFVIKGVRYVMLFLRDLAPIAGWNVAIGASANPTELWHPETMVEREGKEEILVLNIAKNLYYRLESPGARLQAIDHHRKVLKMLRRAAIRIEMEPLLGKLVPDAPDQIEVSATWAKNFCPHVTNPGFVIFNPERGENGIEFIQVVEWEIDEELFNLVFLDAEVNEEGKGEPIQQPVGLFRLDDLIHEFVNADPRPIPQHVYDRGTLLSGSVLENWLEKHPHSTSWCPVAYRILRRFIGHAFAIGNSIDKLNDDTWRITFEAKTTVLKDAMGLTYLEELLTHPGISIPCAKLWALEHPADFTAGTGGEVPTPVLPTAQPTLDHKALKAYRARQKQVKKRLTELTEDISEAVKLDEMATVLRLHEEQQTLKDELAPLEKELKAHGWRQGQSSRFRTPHDRICASVKRNLNRLRREIKKHDESLWKHLKESLRVGHECIYAPSLPRNWNE